MHSFIVHTLLLLALPAADKPDQAANTEIKAAYKKLSDAIQAQDVNSLSGLLTESFRCTTADGASQTGVDWGKAWRNHFRNIEAFASVAYEVNSIVVEPGVCRVIVDRTSFFRYAGAVKESVQVCRTEDEWVMQKDGWRLHHQRELGFPDDGEVTEGARAPESKRLRQLQDEFKLHGKQSVDEFIETMRGHAPLVEQIDTELDQQLVTFLYHGNPAVQRVTMAGGPFQAAPKTFERLEKTDLWYRTEKLPADARFVYFLTVTQPRRKESENKDVLTTLSHPDPLNPRLFNGGSVVWPTDIAPPVCSKKVLRELRGRLTEHMLSSTTLGEERSFSVYAPPTTDECPCLLIALDGEDYASLIPTPLILDNLIAAKQLPPTVAVLVNQQGQRFRDLRCSAPFASFLATELVPWIRGKYRTTSRPDGTVIAGASLGGLMAAFASKSNPDVFGKVLSQSGAFWFHPQAGQDGWLATQFADADPLPVEFWMEVGSFESTSMLSNNRRFRDVLRAKGYRVQYREYNGGHDYLTWRDSLATGLVHLLGKNNGASD
jgi:enterochelin esterase-like enzyme